MEITLKRIKRDSYDSVMKRVIDNFTVCKLIELDEKDLEDNSELIFVDGNEIIINYDVEQYTRIVDNDDLKTYEKLALIGMLLHKETKDINGIHIPQNVLFEKEVWSYLSFKVFTNIVKKLRLEDDDSINEDKIERFFFNNKMVSRTGLLFIWVMIDRIDAESDYDMAKTAFQFIDPVKAMFERTITRNPIVLKAFVQAIINCKCDSRIKNTKYRTRVPKHLSCFARINVLDAYSYDELVNVMSDQINAIITVA